MTADQVLREVIAHPNASFILTSWGWVSPPPAWRHVVTGECPLCFLAREKKGLPWDGKYADNSLYTEAAKYLDMSREEANAFVNGADGYTGDPLSRRVYEALREAYAPLVTTGG